MGTNNMMRLFKFACSFLFFSLISLPSFAETSYTYDWGSLRGGLGAGVEYGEYSDEAKSLDASIGHSKSGHQRIYFSNYYSEKKNICSYTSSYPTTSTIIFNGQAVKMSRWCKKFADVDQYYYEYTPETYMGDSYVINLFKKATTPIRIQMNGETFHFPVLGFTKAWNSAGGDAI